MAIKNKTIGSAIMTNEQINSLPHICQVIVKHDRYVESLCCAPIVSFDEFKRSKRMSREYIREAASLFMPLSVKNGPAPA